VLPDPIAARRQQRQLQLGADALRFRELIAKVGSGERTSTGLDRAEAAEALTRLLQGQVSEAQAGAFLIAHRLRRPQPCELAGMVDAYGALGPRLPTSDRPVISFGVPFDGRSRTAPVLPLTALLLNAAGLAVVLQGGDPMPVKYGVTHAELLLETRVLSCGSVQLRAGHLQFVLQVVDLVFLIPQLPLEELLVQVALAAGEAGRGDEGRQQPEHRGHR